MSNIVLTASVRQNLLSLQDTAALLSTTQTRLATGKKVNSALDNPTNFFTAAGLDARASDIGNLLDSIGNGVQVLQAADTGISSLQKLVDTAKSIRQPACRSPPATAPSPASSSPGRALRVALAARPSPTSPPASSTAGFSHSRIPRAPLSRSPSVARLRHSIRDQDGAVQSLDQFNQALAVAGVNLHSAISGPDSLTFISTTTARFR